MIKKLHDDNIVDFNHITAEAEYAAGPGIGISAEGTVPEIGIGKK